MPTATDTTPTALAQLLAECATGRRSWQAVPQRGRGRYVQGISRALEDLHGQPRIDPRSVRVVRGPTPDVRHVTAHAVWPSGQRRALGFTVHRDGRILSALAMTGGGQHVRTD